MPNSAYHRRLVRSSCRSWPGLVPGTNGREDAAMEDIGDDHTMQVVHQPIRRADMTDRDFPGLVEADAGHVVNYTVRPPASSLFHRHALGQIPRLVHVAAAQNGGVVGQQL